MDFRSFLKGEKSAAATSAIMSMDAPPTGAYDYDLVVIGGGSGGLSAAKRAADLGKRVALCDFVAPSPQGSKWGLGGTCVNVGCIPKKLMHQSAQQGSAMKEQAGSYGWTASDVTFSWPVLQQNVIDYIRSLNWGYTVTLRDKQVTYFNSFAEFGDDSHTLRLTTKQGTVSTVTADKVLLAMGGRPTIPDVPGAKEFGITSDDIFFLERPPGRTLVVNPTAGIRRGLQREGRLVYGGSLPHNISSRGCPGSARAA